MEGIGAYLKRQREMRKIRIEDVSQFTKINLTMLRILEADDIEHLPASAFVRGFVCSYAKAIGLDGDEALLQFQELGNPGLKLIARGVALKPPTFKLQSWVLCLLFLVFVLVVAYFVSK